MMQHPTSLRLRTEARDLLDAWATLLTDRRGSRQSRMDVISFALRNLRPPTGSTPAEADVRRAYKALFEADPT